MNKTEEETKRNEIMVNARRYVTDCVKSFGQVPPSKDSLELIALQVADPVLRAWGIKP